VIDGSRADVSFIAGLITDKFCYHQPLYRQHQRLGDNGIRVSRPWLTQLTHAALALLEPVFTAQLDSIRASRIKAMDETPIKAGRAGPGKMKGGYFWPVYGERDEICFAYHEGRSGKHIAQTLGTDPPPEGAVLLTDGYAAYERYAQKCGLTRAQCWAHSRRKFFEAQSVEPERAAQALEMIGQLYAVEQHIREVQLVGEARRAHRLAQAKPMADRFFDWVDAQFESHGLLPSSPLTTALAYVRERRAALEVYLADPEVPIDTNHLERALRVVPMGRRNWLFCWTEVGAKYVGIAQSLIATCRLHDIDPLYLSGRCAPARRSAPCRRGRATHPQAVEATLRSQPASIRPPPKLEVGKNAARLPLTDEFAVLEPLGEQAQPVAVPPQHLDPVSAPAPEHEELSAEGIDLELGLNERGQAVEAAPHVGDPGCDPDPRARRRDDHRSSTARTCASTWASGRPFDSQPCALALDRQPTERGRWGYRASRARRGVFRCI
jgi:hypothetical protein